MVDRSDGIEVVDARAICNIWLRRWQIRPLPAAWICISPGQHRTEYPLEIHTATGMACRYIFIRNSSSEMDESSFRFIHASALQLDPHAPAAQFWMDPYRRKKPTQQSRMLAWQLEE